MRYAYSVTATLLAGGAALSLAGFPAGAQVAQNDDSQMARVVPRAGAPESFADLTEQLQPAVVNISTRQRIEVASRNTNPFAGTPFEDLFNQRRGETEDAEPQFREGQSLGSGFIISADGYVVTNNHVVNPPGQRAELEEVTVTLPDGNEYEAEVVGTDPQSDLAVLKISRREAFPFVTFGDSRQARVGDWVIAIGNPFGLGGTVTSGIVSSVLRSAGGGAYDRYLQTDASINRGNSGGPLFDMQGNVIGINNAIISPTGGSVGIGFAIPAETAEPIVDKLVRGVEIERGYLGIQIQPVNDDVAASLGLRRNRGEIVQMVQPGEAAARAGIEPGDIVLTVNGREVTPDQTLSYLVANIAPGTTIPVEVMRDGQRRQINVTVGKRPSEEELRQSQMFDPDAEPEDDMAPSDNEVIENSLGLQVLELTPAIARQLGADAATRGLVVASVDQNSDAARKGLRRGDILLTANYNPLVDVADLEKIVRGAQSDDRDAVLLRVQRRGGSPQYIAVRLR
ncbi:Do family serine endopeptidase [Qipengyuania aurantiaca]|uniref:Probable periplasmic serine endoprotease DegP-like n=1 Tax=Qipengyuania aurantiaca TaxID=2867233 RepID=A0ABX8ZQA0_9SPHN|nr:Do family serine endopeptidase [Qipengyuania aurantiaca]QZD91208.1 Do family serine endopeptidase [Qipengyuania aurantiaca]